MQNVIKIKTMTTLSHSPNNQPPTTMLKTCPQKGYIQNAGMSIGQSSGIN